MTPVGASYDRGCPAQLRVSPVAESEVPKRMALPPALSLEKTRLFPAYIWWHQLGALGTTGMSSGLWRGELTAH